MDITRNFVKLIHHLIPLSDCPNSISVEDFIELIIQTQWEFQYSDSNELKEDCPCGRKNIIHRCWIQNNVTGIELFVGNCCIKRFGIAGFTGSVSIGAYICKPFDVTLNQICCKDVHFTLKRKNSPLVTHDTEMMEAFTGLSPLDVDRLSIEVQKGDIVCPFVIGQPYVITLQLKRGCCGQALYVLLTCKRITEQTQYEKDQLFMKIDQSHHRVIIKPVANDPGSRQVYLIGQTKPIKEDIKAKWRGARWDNEKVAWRITRDEHESLSSIRDWLDPPPPPPLDEESF